VIRVNLRPWGPVAIRVFVWGVHLFEILSRPLLQVVLLSSFLLKVYPNVSPVTAAATVYITGPFQGNVT
jgi:hypothetical protein